MFNQIAAIIIAAATAAPVLAQQSLNCAPREAVIERLSSTYGETRQSIGLGEHGMVIETFASNDTGTWTITVTNAHGLTCLVASGQSWAQVAKALPPKGDKI